MTNALILYGIRYGATASTSEEVTNVLRQEGLEVQVVDARKERIKDVSKYDLVIVGSGIQMGRRVSEIENFLKRFRKGLAAKKVALFVSCGSGCTGVNEGKPDVIARARREFLEEKAAKYDLQPIALGLACSVASITTIRYLGGPRGGWTREGRR
jgi:menaquinone-dependent protoporphyrinogen oxidase